MTYDETAARRARARFSCAVLVAATTSVAHTASAQTVDAGKTGFDLERPVLAAACEHGCPWGELGDFLVEAMQPLGYDVVVCRNCNGDQGPPLVSTAGHAPQLGVADTFVGTTTRIDAAVDFGVTESGLLTWAYDGKYDYAMSGPYANLRLIAKLEDPTYLLVAAKSDSSIHDLSDIAKQHLGVKMIGGDTPISKAVLDYYGITADALTSWGGTMQNAIVAGAVGSTDFDVIVSELGSPANNPESSIWPELSQKFDLRFFDLPDELLTQLASTTELGVTRVTAKWGFLRGVDHAIATVARSGEAFFARDDAPEQAAYDVAKAIDAHRDALKWYIRPYSYDSRTVWTNGDVPLHPGAARYYREAGYMGAAACTAAAKDDAATMPGAHERSGGCTIEGAAARNGALGGAVALATLIGLSRRRRRARR